MKQILLITLLGLLTTLNIYAQNGAYLCFSQEFNNENNPASNVKYTETVNLIIDINDPLGGFIIVAYTGNKPMICKYDILRNIGTQFDKEKNIVYTKYTAKLTLLNIQLDPVYNIFLMENKSKKTFDILITESSLKSNNWFYDLRKI